MNKVAIIGGGAAGLMAAITAVKSEAAVEVFEQNDRVGKKILASGNGRCNISNINLSRHDYFGEHPDFVDFALSQFDFNRFKKFCSTIGLLLNTKEDGRTYPLSDEARSVVLALEAYADSLGIIFHFEQSIRRVEKRESHFTLHTDEKIYRNFASILIATGSEAAPQLGGNADGYTFALGFGHTVKPAYPSLVALELDSPYPAKMSGTKQFARVTLYIDGKARESVQGDILFTRYGISGFAILDISQHASVALMQHHRVDIGLKLLIDYDRQSLSTQIAQLCKNVPSHPIETVLSGLLSSKMVRYILETSTILAGTPAKEIDTKMIKRIANTILDWRFGVSDTHGFKHAEVSGGGVNTDEINPKTMESKKVKGLYFAGEVLDIVGKRGGYNLHFAWASGFLAGRAMTN